MRTHGRLISSDPAATIPVHGSPPSGRICGAVVLDGWAEGLYKGPIWPYRNTGSRNTLIGKPALNSLEIAMFPNKSN
jgi:hypothetical protein